jgi:hypothetical protein
LIANLRILRHVPNLPPFAREATDKQLMDLVKLNQKSHPDTAKQYLAMAQMRDYVDSDFPHDVEISDAIIRATTGYAIADSNGNVICHFDNLMDAEFARGNAKLDVSVDVKLPKAEDF